MRRGLRAQKVLVASAARIAPGGGSGPFQWLVPGLVVIVVLFAALNVRSEANRSSSAATAAARAQAFSSAVRESSALREAVRARHGTNAQIKAQADDSLARVKAALPGLERSPPDNSEGNAIARLVAGADNAQSLVPPSMSADGPVQRF